MRERLDSDSRFEVRTRSCRLARKLRLITAHSMAGDDRGRTYLLLVLVFVLVFASTLDGYVACCRTRDSPAFQLPVFTLINYVYDSPGGRD